MFEVRSQREYAKCVGGHAHHVLFDGDPPMFNTVDGLLYSYMYNGFATLDRVFDVFICSKNVYRFSVSGNDFLAGMGFIGKYGLHEKVIPLIYVNSKGKAYVKNSTEVPELGLIKRFTDKWEKDIVMADDISEYFGKKFKIPAFKSLKDRKKFLDDLVTDSLEDLKRIL